VGLARTVGGFHRWLAASVRGVIAMTDGADDFDKFYADTVRKNRRPSEAKAAADPVQKIEHSEPERSEEPLFGDSPPTKRIKFVMGSEIAPQTVNWLWEDWLALGKLHILAGRPGALKTTTALAFAAAVSIGGEWPDRKPAAQGKIVIWSGEDAIDDTLLPRFLAAGGNRDRIAFIGGVEEDGKARAFDPANDIAALAQVCANLGQVSLIIIDPIVAVAKGDSHKNAEARRDLQPLVTLAERTQAAVLGVHHLTKRTEGADPVDRVSGSPAFGA
jgi:RecA-family ATPase